MIKKSIISIYLIGCLIIINGCAYGGYSGKNVDLYTVAINSILWNIGHSYGADRAKDSEIEVVEKDDYGRTLFTYHEKYYSGGELSFRALVVSQYSLENHVYYYEDYNFIIMKRELPKLENDFFSNEDIECLKASNDWNKDINLEKCIKKTISKFKQDIPVNSTIIREKIIEEYELDEDYILFMHYLTEDIGGNFIIYGSLIRFNSEDIYYAILVNMENDSIKEVNFFVPTNLYDYQYNFVNFKEQNGWQNNRTRN